jgi:acyl carrier protein
MDRETDIINEVLKFLKDELQVNEADLSNSRDQDLWDDGIIDSMGLVRLIAFLESKFGINFAIERLAEPDFVSLSGMAQLVMEQDASNGKSST